MKKYFLFFIRRLHLIFALSFFWGCKPIQNEFWVSKTYKDFWDKKDPLILNFSSLEGGSYKISFILSHAYSYLHKNLALQLEIYLEENLIEKKTPSFALQDLSLRWLSSGAGLIKKRKLEGGEIKLEKNKNYKILLFHVMEEEKLKNIKEIFLWMKPTSLAN